VARYTLPIKSLGYLMSRPLTIYAIVGIAALAIALIRAKHRQWNALDPSVTFWIGYAVYYGAANVLFLLSLESLYANGADVARLYSYLNDNIPLLEDTASLTVVFGVSVMFGMFVLGPRLAQVCVRPLAIKLAAPPDIPLALLWPFGVLNWALELGLVPNPEPVAPSVLLQAPAAICLALNARLAYRVTQQASFRSVSTAIGVIAISAMSGAASGMKQQTVTVLLSAFVGFTLGVRRAWPLVMAMAFGLPVFMYLQAANSAYREAAWYGDARISALERVALVNKAVWEVAASEEWRPFAYESASRLCTAVPMVRTLELDRAGNGMSFTEGFLTPSVPRLFWHDKPAIVTGGTLYERMSGNAGSSASPGQPAEAFMYGGLIAVMLMGCGLGVLGACSSEIIQQLWAFRRASLLGVMTLTAVIFGKCENWLCMYLPTLINSISISIGLRLLAGFLSGKPAPRLPGCRCGPE
jgi:hypothetical protein